MLRFPLGRGLESTASSRNQTVVKNEALQTNALSTRRTLVDFSLPGDCSTMADQSQLERPDYALF